MRQAAAITAQIKAAFGLETQLIEGLTDFLRGFKEIKLNSLKSLEFGEHMKQLSANVAQGRIAAQREIAGNFVTSELMVFSLLGIVVFILPLATDLPTSTVVTVAATVLFMNGPISLVLGGVSLLQKMNAAAEAILLLDDRLSSFAMPPVVPSSAPSVFDRITLRGVYFRYRNEYEREGFALGPIDLEIKRGQIIFIVGKNGCGKSTLLKLVTGLYSPSQGTLSIDEQEVTAENAPTYSNLFSSIFADSHLTRRLYGIPDLNAAEVEELLDLLEINDKTRLVGKTFETVALSTGQRKRLLMVTALLEHRSVYVFDEWAADQDIHYRNKFYRMILPKLKSLGKTVVAVTHDENYFDAADVCLQFDDGQLRTWSDSKSRAVL